jgi:hypothetical protein
MRGADNAVAVLMVLMDFDKQALVVQGTLAGQTHGPAMEAAGRGLQTPAHQSIGYWLR